MKDQVERTGDGGTEDEKQRCNGKEQRIRATKKVALALMIGRVQRSGNKVQSCERGDRGRETRSKATRQGTEDRRQGTET
jgi:hypothetical protein